MGVPYGPGTKGGIAPLARIWHLIKTETLRIGDSAGCAIPAWCETAQRQKMASIQERLERLENERRFLQWLHFERFLEGLSDEQLEAYVRHNCLPAPLPEPLPIGTSGWTDWTGRA